jgi:hypothetical protein
MAFTPEYIKSQPKSRISIALRVCSGQGFPPFTGHTEDYQGIADYLNLYYTEAYNKMQKAMEAFHAEAHKFFNSKT